jgi:hypothetical protein
MDPPRKPTMDGYCKVIELDVMLSLESATQTAEKGQSEHGWPLASLDTGDT